jgi:hypothetical protein
MRDDLFVVELVAPEIAVCRACLLHQRWLFFGSKALDASISNEMCACAQYLT